MVPGGFGFRRNAVGGGDIGGGGRIWGTGRDYGGVRQDKSVGGGYNIEQLNHRYRYWFHPKMSTFSTRSLNIWYKKTGTQIL